MNFKLIASTMKFLKGAALLQSHLFEEEELPCTLGPFAVHHSLCDYLGVSSVSPTTAIPKELIGQLIDGLGVHLSSATWAKISRLPTIFSRPRLLTPPGQFSRFLMKYLNVNCSFCHSKPKKGVVCLICGEVFGWLILN